LLPADGGYIFQIRNSNFTDCVGKNKIKRKLPIEHEVEYLCKDNDVPYLKPNRNR